MTSLAAAFVDSRGADIVSDGGNAFGTMKPKAQRKAAKAIYSAKKTDDESDGDA